MPAQSDHQFKVFVDEHSPEQASQVQREWRKKAQQKLNSCRNRVMIVIVVIMILVFVVLISFLAEEKKSHIEVDYPDQNYAYIQSVYPHLKFLMERQTSTTEIRLVKALGTLYPQMIAWVEGSLQPGMRVLLVPNQKAGVNVLGIALGYYLLSSEQGNLKILIDSPSYRTLTEANLNQMRKQHGSNRFPVQILSKSQYQSEFVYDLIVIQNNNFHQQIKNFNQTNIVVIRKETTYNTIISSFFSGHGQYQIIKGISNTQIRQTGKWEGYAIVPYVLTDTIQMNVILLLAQNYPEVGLCPEQIKDLQQGDRNMVEYLRNKTYNHASIYYELQLLDKAIIDAIIGFQHVLQVYVLKGIGLAQHLKVKQVNSLQDFSKSQENYLIIRPESLKQSTLAKGDKIFVKIQNEGDLKLLQAKFTAANAKISVILPYNNGGCFYPPEVIPFTQKPYSKSYFVMVQPKTVQPDDQN